MARERGTVRWWKEDEGYGCINDVRGNELFCHFMFLEMDGFRSLREGDLVGRETTIGYILAP